MQSAKHVWNSYRWDLGRWRFAVLKFIGEAEASAAWPAHSLQPRPWEVSFDSLDHYLRVARSRTA